MAKELKQLRKRCNEIHEQRRNAVKLVLEQWLESFITFKHYPWKAVEGNKKLSPIPIHKDFWNFDKERDANSLTPHRVSNFFWPDLLDEEIIDIIKDLGFHIYSRSEQISIENMCLAIPPYKDGEPLTFAQEWMKKINDSYSKYVADEKLKAKSHYKKVLRELANYDINKVRIDKEYIVFEEYQYDEVLSCKCAAELARLLEKDGIRTRYNKDKDFPEAYIPLKHPK